MEPGSAYNVEGHSIYNLFFNLVLFVSGSFFSSQVGFSLVLRVLYYYVNEFSDW